MVQTPAQRNARTAASETKTDNTLQYALDHQPPNGTWMKTWDTEDDPCDACEHLDGSEIDADETWSGVDGPPLHPNCKCHLQLRERYWSAAETLANQIMPAGFREVKPLQGHAMALAQQIMGAR